MGCWVNSFTPEEILLWQACGLRSLHQILNNIPQIQCGLVHAQRHQNWPERCEPALTILRHKDRLLALAPSAWVDPFLVLGTQLAAESEHQMVDETPAWWVDAVRHQGLVLKPLLGHGCRTIVHVRQLGGELLIRTLFSRLPDSASSPPPEPTPTLLADYCHQLAGTTEPFLAQPYRTQGPDLLPSDPAVVLRVISNRRDPEAPITIERTWLEIPLASDPHEFGSEGRVVVVDLKGHALPLLGAPLTQAQELELRAWKELLKHPPAILEHCLEASVEMHRRLPPINAVAWDWIPAAQGPVLLEGNGGFSLLEPQLLEALSA